MNLSHDSALGLIVTILPSILGLIQSRGWLTAISLAFVGTSILTGTYAQRERSILNSTSVMIEGHSIDSLNMGNLRRRVNQSLVIQEAYQIARVDGTDLKMSWRYSGYCRTERESAIDFSIDSDNSIPFEALDCFAHDLGRDPGRRYRIRPILVGPDGISKKITVPLLAPLGAQQPFSVLLNCVLPGCIKAGFGYYTSTLSFAQRQVRRSKVRLAFVGEPPAWVRVYEQSAFGTALLKQLRPCRERKELTEYVDVARNVRGQSARIYIFWRPLLSHNKSADDSIIEAAIHS